MQDPSGWGVAEILGAAGQWSLSARFFFSYLSFSPPDECQGTRRLEVNVDFAHTADKGICALGEGAGASVVAARLVASPYDVRMSVLGALRHETRI